MSEPEDEEERGKEDAARQMGIPEEISRELEGVPEAVRQPFMHFISNFSGPLPPPGFAEKYERICPGSFDRILAMAESSQKHRHEMEHKLIDAEIADSHAERIERKRGQYCGLAIGIATLVAGSATAVAGYPIGGTIIGTSGLVGLVSVFVYGRHVERKSKESGK